MSRNLFPAILLLLCGATSCSDANGPLIASVRVRVATQGDDLAADYQLKIEPGLTRIVGVTSTTTVSGIEPGVTRVTLLGVPHNCEVEGGEEKELLLGGGRTTDVDFRVDCTLRTGSLTVNVSTSGAPLDGDGYTIEIDGGSRATVPVNSETLVSDIFRGRRQVRLSGMIPNCNPGPAQFVDVPDGGNAALEFSVVCIPESGALQVNVSSVGLDLDKNGYLVTVGDNSQQLPANGSLALSGIAVGTYTVLISEIAPNCLINGNSSIPVTIVDGLTITIDLAVGCVRNAGTVRFTTITTGPNQDQNGYTVLFPDDYYGTPVPANGVTTFSQPLGSRTLVVEGMAPNCVPAGSRELVVGVAAGETTEIEFVVNCQPAGSVRVSTTTSGTALDAGGYRVRVVDVTDGNHVGSNGSAVIGGIPVGVHQVHLSDVATNCDIFGANPVSVTVTAGTTVTASFKVSCLPLGTLEFSALTTGDGADLDGYQISVLGPNFARTLRIAATGTVALTRVPSTGPHEVVLTEVAPNCESSTPHISVSAPAGQTTRVQFQVSCTTPSHIAFAAISQGWDIFTVQSNGGDLNPLTQWPGNQTDPAWSPEGTRIAFANDASGTSDIYAMDADGGNVVQLTSDPSDDTQPAWSPDGSKIVFVSNQSGANSLYIMRVADLDVQRITGSPAPEQDPAWSPDGTRIAFVPYIAERPVLHIMNVDGTGIIVSRDVFSRERHPAWSPDGNLITYEMDDCYYPFGCHPKVVTIRSDLTGSPVIHDLGRQPSWSADGRWIIYNGLGCSTSCSILAAKRVDNPGTARVTISPHLAVSPVWR